MKFDYSANLAEQKEAYLLTINTFLSEKNKASINTPSWEEAEKTIRQYGSLLFNCKNNKNIISDLRSDKLINENQKISALDRKIISAANFLHSKVLQASDQQKSLDEETKLAIVGKFSGLVESYKNQNRKKNWKEETIKDLTHLANTVPLIVKISECFLKKIKRFEFTLNRDESQKEFRKAIDRFRAQLFPESYANHKTFKELATNQMPPQITYLKFDQCFNQISAYLTGVALRICREKRTFTGEELFQVRDVLNQLKQKASNIQKLSDYDADLENLQGQLKALTEAAPVKQESSSQDTSETHNSDEESIEQQNKIKEVQKQTIIRQMEYIQKLRQHVTQTKFYYKFVESTLPIKNSERPFLKELYTHPEEVLTLYIAFAEYLQNEVSYQPKEISSSWFPFW